MAATPDTNLGFQNFFQATLTGDITSSSTDILMDNIPNSAQGFLVIEPDSTTNREVIFYTSKTALKVVCPSAADGRGQDDTTAVAHSTGATVIMAPVAAFYEALQNGRALNNVFGGAQLGAVNYYTTPGANTWTKPTGLKFVIVEVVGGGGGGGGNAATSGVQISVGSGGGGGGYSRKKIAAASLGATETATVGAAGTNASGASGGNGGTSSFGAHCSATGGLGGVLNTGNTSGGTYQPGNTGGSGSSGDLNISGGPGFMAGTFTVSNNVAYGGQGGNSPLGYGFGGRGMNANNAGGAASGYGGGGGGAAASTSVGAQTGGAATAGIVVVYEYY